MTSRAVRSFRRRRRGADGAIFRVFPPPRRHVASPVCPRYPTHLSTEQFHSTPDTQTDAAYNHPEDIEHFSHHETIEWLEAEREAKYQGITVQEALRAHEEPPESAASRPKIMRVPPTQDPAEKYKDIDKETESQSEWGTGEQGYKQPKSPAEKMRSVLSSRWPTYAHRRVAEKIYHTRYETLFLLSGRQTHR
jgi:hypothetical protein